MMSRDEDEYLKIVDALESVRAAADFLSGSPSLK